MEFLLVIAAAAIIVPVGIAAIVLKVSIKVLGWLIGACFCVVLLLLVLVQCFALV